MLKTRIFKFQRAFQGVLKIYYLQRFSRTYRSGLKYNLRYFIKIPRCSATEIFLKTYRFPGFWLLGNIFYTTTWFRIALEIFFKKKKNRLKKLQIILVIFLNDQGSMGLSTFFGHPVALELFCNSDSLANIFIESILPETQIIASFSKTYASWASNGLENESILKIPRLWCFLTALKMIHA